ncbi:hypothetical protein [Acetobacter conturbans]|uniref:Outer membrane protein beta-barrel domain-containing protein n=1 Tax=Acetobacter conturbans TaxID=1737472 RepID=A0ABX0JZT4_9PROT|nr:hypothetical protein [Acetobacter conturbans]NHN88919.1 hypothetical protein [Acetobacter conturbans]
MTLQNFRLHAARLLRAAAFLLSAATLLPAVITPAKAAPLPVIAVNREIGLSVTGNFQDLTSNSGHNDSYNYTTPYWEEHSKSSGSERNHVSGWTPGFRVDGQYMFETAVIKHVYAAASFSLDDGEVDDNYSTHWHDSGAVYNDQERGKTGVNRSNINVRGEFGKGFLLLDDHLLITPTIQGGFTAGGSNTFTAFGKGYVGLALHADYAITERLVIRGRVGWAQFLDTHSYFYNNPRRYAGASRPQWSGDIGLDYRMTDRIHLTRGVSYTYLNDGRAKETQSDRNLYFNNSQSSRGISWSNGVQLRLGASYQL